MCILNTLIQDHHFFHSCIFSGRTLNLAPCVNQMEKAYNLIVSSSTVFPNGQPDAHRHIPWTFFSKSWSWFLLLTSLLPWALVSITHFMIHPAGTLDPIRGSHSGNGWKSRATIFTSGTRIQENHRFQTDHDHRI